MFDVAESLVIKTYPTTAPLTIVGLLNMGINILVGFAFALSIISAAWGCYLYIMSRGDPKAVQQAWNSIVYAGFGALFAFGTIALRFIIPRAVGVSDPTVLNADF